MSNSPEDFSGLDAGPKPQQDAEKARERSSKAQARAQRLGRDEKKSRRHDTALAALLASLLADPSRSDILDVVLDGLEAGLPSHFLVGAVSLSDAELSKFVRQGAGKIPQVIAVPAAASRGDFNEHHIDPQLQLRMNAWFDDLVTSLFSESSVVATQRFLDLVSPVVSLQDDDALAPVPSRARPAAVVVLARTFSWFLDTIAMDIAPHKATSYAEFILDETIRRARAFLANADQELLSRADIDLFGV